MSGAQVRAVTLGAPLERAAVIGDIHGHADALAALLAEIPASRPVFVLGDLVDRGPESARVIDLLIARGVRGVCGNHELWLRRWMRGEAVDIDVLDPDFGAAATLASYGFPTDTRVFLTPPDARLPDAHRAFLLGLPHALALAVAGVPYWLVHAGLPPVRADAPDTLEEWLAHRADAMLWGNARLDARPKAPATVLMGHLPQQRVVDLGHLVDLDTGAATLHGGRLTALLLPERRCVHVEAPRPF
jgi:serine/threonine protein phosphatase 1